MCVVIAACMVGNRYWSVWWNATARLQVVIDGGRIDVTLYETPSVHPGISLSPIHTQMSDRAYNRWLIRQMAESVAFHTRWSNASVSLVWLLVLAAASTAALFGVDAWVAARRRHGRCNKCRYDLRGLAAGAVCPECGAATRVD